MTHIRPWYGFGIKSFVLNLSLDNCLNDDCLNSKHLLQVYVMPTSIFRSGDSSEALSNALHKSDEGVLELI